MLKSPRNVRAIARCRRRYDSTKGRREAYGVSLPLAAQPPTTQPQVWGFDALQWDVIGVLSTGGGLIIAGLGAFIAARQYAHTQKAQREQAQEAERSRLAHAEQAEVARLDRARPYVQVTVERGETSSHILDVVISNIGAGPARDVSITVDPPLTRARNDDQYQLHQARVFTEPIEMLPPGFRLRMFFDSAIERHEADPKMPSRHRVNVKYHDGHSHHWEEESTLDLDLMSGILYTETYNIHHVAKALREMQKSLQTQADALSRPLPVIVEERAAHQERVERENAERKRAHEALVQQVIPPAAQEGDGSR